MPPFPNFLIDCLTLVHGLQDERGQAMVDLSQNETLQTSGEMTHRRVMTDIAAEKALTPRPLPEEHPFAPLLDEVKGLSVWRNAIDARSRPINEIAAWYTTRLIQPALDRLTAVVLRTGEISPVRASAFVYLLQWHEHLCHERDRMSQLAGQAWLHDQAFVQRLKQIIQERQAYERLFWGVADLKQRQACFFLKKILGETPCHGKTEDKAACFASKIAALQEATFKLATQLVEAALEPCAPASNGTLDSEVAHQFEWIRTLPLFRGIKQDMLREILRPAHLVPHDKGSLILAQGETPQRVYIILDGWVKVYKSSADGQEAVLQLLGKRDCLLACSLYPSDLSPLNARAITKTRLLSLPASFLRDQLVQHKDLALNALALASRQMHRLIGHFDQLQLHSAKERLGHFLLRLVLDTGIGGPAVDLPFDKSLIAAYLGIQPETFSRLLHGLRGQGFSVERNRITLPEPYALCPYCDSDTMQKCDLADSASCPRVETRKVEFG